MLRTAPNKSMTILLTCLLTGTADALAAILISYRIPPPVIFKFIASAWFGREALSGGTAMILCGLIFHYLIAAAFSITLFLLYPYAEKVFKNKLLIGLIYGLAIWLIMNYLVLPVTNLPKGHGHVNTMGLIKGIGALVICVGEPIALMADNYYKKQIQS